MVLPRFAGIRPVLVAPCGAPDDVAAALEKAREGGLAVAVRSGGHCFAGRSSGTGVVIDVSPMAGVEVDGDRAVIGAGTRLAGVYDALAAHGRTIPAGCGPTVGIAGLTLGGGLGILGRRHGLTCDSLLAATLVLADGRTIEADDELLWLLRGGGAPGVVTSLTFRTVPAPDSTAFRLTFPAAAATHVLDAWQLALPALDDAVAASLVVTAPPDPAAPLAVKVFGAAPHPAAVDDLIRRLDAAPLTDDRRHGTHRETKQWLAGDDAPDDRYAYPRSQYFRGTVPAADLLDLVTADRVAGEERELDFSPWGGAYNRVAADATAFPHRDARFLLKQTATVPAAQRPGGWLDASFALTRPFGTGGAYPNFPEPGLPDEAYYLGNTGRVRELRARYDPSGVFTAQPSS
ncbi:FAD-binding oxidoreductase [Dactylosporangium siamense]|uniref:FAD-binding oxidoreductase n=1 Tax=Dactylosporangium siamense TaxID=685454 RepID=UPI001941E1BB|nr:FAD-dependent oxidoreductase [Dactylosporangium siamense]